MPTPTPAGIRAVKATAQHLTQRAPRFNARPLGEFVEAYRGAKRRNYERALQRVRECDGQLARSRGYIKMFVKAEKLNPSAKHDPDPRAIQFRSMEFNVVAGRWIKPVEEWIYRITGQRFGWRPQGRMIAKGMNHVKRGNIIARKRSRFQNPVVVSLDASRFDQHVDETFLKIEHEVYLALCRDPPMLRKLLSWQMNNLCFSMNNIAYFVRGKRMSGDLNTALGNCLLSVLMAVTWLESLDIDYDILDDGDDLLVFCDARDLDNLLKSVKPAFLEFGHEMKIENVAYTMEDVCFCRSHPVFDGHDWRMVRPWQSVLSTALTGTKFANVERERAAYVAANGACELTVNQGMPILQEYAVALLRNAKVQPGDMIFDDLFDRMRVEQRRLRFAAAQTRPVSDVTRLSFQRAFGIAVHDQVDMERHLRNWTFEIGGGMEVGLDRDGDWTSIQVRAPELAPGGYLA